jgi:N-acetyl-gamma-glutamylphosphate reductase
MGYKVAVVGATGNVGREMLNILDERKFPADEVVVLASRRSVGIEVSYGDRTLKVKALEHYDFSDIDICLMSAGGSVSKEWSPKIGAAGAVVIDNSSAWRMDPDVRLHQEEHHRQPELLDRAARRRAEAAARQGDDHARRGRDLSIGVGRRQGCDGRIVLADQGRLHQ